MALDLLTIARELVHERGFSVIPLDHPAATHFPHEPSQIGKRPIGDWKAFQHRPPTDEELVEWFGPGSPPRNIGIVTGAVSNVIVVDGDSPAALDWMRLHLPPTQMRTKTAKGAHWFYRYPGVAVPNKSRLRIDGSPLQIDVRGDGGQVVAPPSLHRSGVSYERLGRWSVVLPGFDPAWLPAPPVVRLTAPAVVTAPPDEVVRRARAYVAKMAPAISGQGGSKHTFQVACVLVRDFALSDAEALDLLREWNQTCQPPWTDRDLARKIDGAHTYGRDPFGAFVDDVDDGRRRS